MKSLLLICSLLVGGLISWYRTGWRIFAIDEMLTPNPVLGFLAVIGFFMFIVSFTIPYIGFVPTSEELFASKKTLVRMFFFSLTFFVTGTIADGGWVFAHAMRYGDDHWYCQGFKHAYLHPNEGVVVMRGINDPKDPQQFLVVRYNDCGEKWYQMSEQEGAYPNKGTRVRVAGACLNQQISASVSPKQFQEIRF